MTQSVDPKFNDLMNYRDKIIQLVIDELVFLGNLFQHTNNNSDKKMIKIAGAKLNKILKKQKNIKNKILVYEEYMEIVNLIYQILEITSKKI